MTHAHPSPWHGTPTATLPLLLVAVVATGYLLLDPRPAGGARPWSRWRTASFLTGCALLGLGLTPQLLPYPDGDFRQHMLQHLLIGMFAPLGLMLGAPATRLLRALPPRRGRLVGGTLRSRPLHLLAHPATTATLNLGGLAVLYLTPLYRATGASEPLHQLFHLHFLAAGYLFAWSIAGPDPAPRRPPVPVRLVVLGIAIAVHAGLSQLMYAGALVQLAAVPTAQRQGGAELMYYGGDLAELLLALAMLATWRPHRGLGRPQTGYLSHLNRGRTVRRPPDRPEGLVPWAHQREPRT